MDHEAEIAFVKAHAEREVATRALTSLSKRRLFGGDPFRRVRLARVRRDVEACPARR